MRVRPTITEREALEGRWGTLPERRLLAPEAQEPAERVCCTRLAGTTQLGDGDIGGEAVVELVYPDGTRERFGQYLAFHKSDGFEFGYGGSGPSALAANILGLILPPREAWRLHHDFKREFLAPPAMDRDGGEIPMAAVRAWVEARWAAETADAAAMAEEATTRALLADLEAAEAEDAAGAAAAGAAEGEPQAEDPREVRRRARAARLAAAEAALPPVGAMLTLRVGALGAPAGALALCVERYRIGEDHVGVTLLLENGEACGWGMDELETLGPVLGTVQALAGYTYDDDPGQLRRDWVAGRFREAFAIGRAWRAAGEAGGGGGA